jgi:hypothetical protein
VRAEHFRIGWRDCWGNGWHVHSLRGASWSVICRNDDG